MANKLKPLRGFTDRAGDVTTKADHRATFDADEVRLLQSGLVSLGELRVLSQSVKESLLLIQETSLKVRARIRP